MKTKEFFNALRTNKGLDLQFIFEDQRAMPEGFHITEVKNIRVRSVDCGGKADEWKETQIQLWVPSQVSDRQITTDKGLGILEKVNALSPTDPEADCFFEAENESGQAVVYEPQELETRSGALVVRLGNRKTQCKAAGRAENGKGCCGPQPAQTPSACCR